MTHFGIEETLIHWSSILLLICFIGIGCCILQIRLNKRESQTFTNQTQSKLKGGKE